MPTEARPRLPQSAQDLISFLRDTDQVAAMLGGNAEAFAQFGADYAAAFAKSDPHFSTKVAEARQQGMAQMLRENRAQPLAPVNLTPGSSSARNALYRPEAPGTRVDGIFASLGEFAQAISPKANPSDDGLQGKLARIRNASTDPMTTGIPGDGGFLVPETMRSELLAQSLESSVVRGRATVIPMSTLRVPVPSINDEDHSGSNGVHGGIVGYWTEEGAAMTRSHPEFGRIVLDAKKLTAYAEAPNELVADAPAFGAVINRLFPEAVTFYEDTAFLDGSGAGEPLGILNGDALISITRDTDEANSLGFLDLVAMYARMLPASLNRAIWVASPGCIPSLLKLAMPVAGTGTDFLSPPMWLTGGMAGAAPTTLLGRPLVVSEKVPNVASANDITFLDPSYYLIGDRMSLEMLASEHYRFNEDKTAYRFIERVDGRPWVTSPLTPANGGDTLSPFVGLAA